MITNLSVPSGTNPTTFVIQYVIDAVSRKYLFGYFSTEDISQECWVIALTALRDGFYDPARPLEKFLYSHLKNRLKNLVRDLYYRSEPPCGCCSPDSTLPCGKYKAWLKRNLSKKSLMDRSPESRDDIGRTDQPAELASLIDAVMPASLRTDYLRLLDDMPISPTRKSRIRDIVKGVLDGPPEEVSRPL